MFLTEKYIHHNSNGKDTNFFTITRGNIKKHPQNVHSMGAKYKLNESSSYALGSGLEIVTCVSLCLN